MTAATTTVELLNLESNQRNQVFKIQIERLNARLAARCSLCSRSNRNSSYQEIKFQQVGNRIRVMSGYGMSYDRDAR
jgi:hypothetical protein